jgi:glycosyltransferase involved in cell wall biosynthesis
MVNYQVSVFLLTYNQQEFIGQTIESILQQKTTFKYQLIIGEDCSTDNTRAICEKFANEYKDVIKLLPSYKNLGLISNFIRTYKECTGKYIAICDGDDYWIDPLKLQKQVGFLETNPKFNLVFTSFKYLFPDGRLLEKDYSTLNSITGFQELIFENYISSVTAVFRNKQNNEDMPRWLGNCPYGDWPLYLWATKEGAKIKFLKDVTAVYRREIGVSEKMKLVPSKIAYANYRIINEIDKDENFKIYKEEVAASLRKHQFEILTTEFKNKNFRVSLYFGLKLFFSRPIKVIRLYFYLLKKNN